MRTAIVLLFSATVANAAPGDFYLKLAAEALLDDGYCMIPSYTARDRYADYVSKGALERGVTNAEAEKVVQSIAASLIVRIEATTGKDRYCATRR